jgi:hypothetical protein
MAGLIVAGFMIWTKRKRSIAPILVYGLIAAFVMYITWPSLWSDPFHHLLESYKTMVNFPWPGTVLFSGHYYQPDSQPISYLPWLITIQLTEVMLPMFFIGFIIAVTKLSLKSHQEILALLLSWLILPAGYLVVTRTPMYDNFRQLLFLLPPVFIVAGLGMEKLLVLLRRGWLKSVLLIICVLPGIIGGLSLHPYEYVYYNSIVGGTQGAYKRFEMDYWMTSFRAAAEYLNVDAEPDAKVVVWVGSHLVSEFVREDILVEPERGNTYSLVGGYQFAVLSSRWGQDEIYPTAEPVFSVYRDGALLVVVKKLTPSDSP